VFVDDKLLALADQGIVRCEIDSRTYNRILETRRVGLYVLLLFLIYLFLQLHAVSCKIVILFSHAAWEVDSADCCCTRVVPLLSQWCRQDFVTGGK